MNSRKLRAALTAILLASTATTGVALMTAGPALAQASVRAVVGKPLTEAQALAGQKNWKAAMAKVNEAEAAPNRTAAENEIIAKMKSYIGVASADPSIGGAPALKAKFTNDYNARKYKDAIEDAEGLKKFGALDTSTMQIVAQAYFQSNDPKGCQKYIQNAFGKGAPDSTLEVLLRCAYDNGDEATQRDTLETLIAHNPKPEYWKSMLKLSERAQGLRDPDTLNIYRLKLLTGAIEGKDEYSLLATLALQLGFPAESQAVLEKAQSLKLLVDERTNRLLALAKGQAGTDLANQPKALAAAQAAPAGEPLVKIGEDMIGQGKAKDAIGVIQAGLAKPLKDKNGGLLRLGMAQYHAGQKADAVKTFTSIKAVDAKDNSAMLAHLWSLAARK